MSKGGRPRKDIDKKQFESLCGLQCRLDEVAAFFDCSVATVERFCHREYGASFAQVFAEKRCLGKISLRRSSFALAARSAPMAIYIWENWFSEKENAAIEKIDDLMTRLDEEAGAEE